MKNLLLSLLASLAMTGGAFAQVFPSLFLAQMNGSGGAVRPAPASGGAASFSSITDTGLTSGRFVLVGTGGLLQDSANFTYIDGTTTGQGIFPVGAVATPSLTFRGDTNTGFYNPAADTLDVAVGGAINSRFVSTHLLLGGLTTDGTGVLQFPVSTTSAGGITFGTDVAFFRKAANSATITTNGTQVLDFGTSTINAGSGVGSTFRFISPGFVNADGTASNSGNGLTQRFRNGYATAGQTPAATTRTYITGSDVGPFTAGQLIVGTMIHWHLKLTKTAAGVASSTFDIAFGTAGSTVDTARVTFTKPAGVAQADDCTVDIYATVKTNSASGVVVGDFTLFDNQTNALGGFLAATKWIYCSPAITSGTFDTTAPTHVGLCITTGASDAYTIDQVQTWTANM